MYTKQTWENAPAQTTPISADRLNHIEDGISDAHNELDTRLSDTQLSAKIGDAIADAVGSGGGGGSVTTVNGKSGVVVLAAADLGLGNVNNTADADKPVSTAMASALSAKAPLASPTFTGDPKAPTPTTTDNDTSIATTAFVRAAIAQFAPTEVVVLANEAAYTALSTAEKNNGKLYVVTGA